MLEFTIKQLQNTRSSPSVVKQLPHIKLGMKTLEGNHRWDRYGDVRLYRVDMVTTQLLYPISDLKMEVFLI